MKTSMNSVSVICRAYDAEAPYIKSFIEHYTAIGCVEFHIVIPKGNPYSYLEAECKSFSNVKLYIDYESNTPLRGAQNVPIPYITTTHIISVDIDEYLDIPDISPLLEHDYVRLNWVICPYSVIDNTDKIAGFVDRQCKYIIKKSLCESMDDHDCKLNQPTTQYESKYKLIHYVYRSFNDLYLKCSMSNYGDYQATNNDKLTTNLEDIKQLPHKFKMAAIYRRIANASNQQYPKLYKIDYTLEDILVKKTTNYANINKLHQALLHYESSINLELFIKEMVNHKIFRLYRRVPHYKLVEFSDKTLIDALEPKNWIIDSSKSRVYNLQTLQRVKNRITVYFSNIFHLLS